MVYWVYCSFPNIRSFTFNCHLPSQDRWVQPTEPDDDRVVTVHSWYVRPHFSHGPRCLHSVSTVSWGKLNGFQLHGLQCWFDTQISLYLRHVSSWSSLNVELDLADSDRIDIALTGVHNDKCWNFGDSNRLVADESHCRCRSWGFPVSRRPAGEAGKTCGLSSELRTLEIREIML